MTMFLKHFARAAAVTAILAGSSLPAMAQSGSAVGDQANTGENSRNVALHHFRTGDPGAFLSIPEAGMLASSKHKGAVQAFVKWVTGKSGQETLRDGNAYEYAIASGVESNARLEPLVKLLAPKLAPEKLNNKAVADLMTATGLL